MPVLSAAALERAAAATLSGLGASEDEARLVASHLVNADLRGVTSHGARAVVMYAASIRAGTIRPGARPSVVREGPSLAVVDGHHGFGQLTCRHAMGLAVGQAAEASMGLVAVVNCNHVGSLADYGMMAVERGLVALLFANCFDGVAPAGGKKAILGTNPICFAAPSGGRVPILLDMATSAVAWGVVARLHRLGQPVPEGQIIDADGNPTTDPAKLIEEPVGALLPLGGYKGYGLGLMVDILAGGLTGSGCGGDMGPDTQGVVMLALDPAFFGPPRDFTARVGALVGRLKGSPRLPDCDEILVPGEREHRLRERRLVEGIPFDDEDWADLGALAAELGVSLD